ncbi:hypothetical protein [Fimbriiglobus ruber]|uniref:Uncharacterized protein n=1 Tax=Fimbriiglobus ruber TaxID=1908690 RepID=A0A225DZP3_9BACT|nr:hypothetical protein [Fimbriiglobus ruber]OWK41587.1 hypothetical protein FRUB_03665 [Fimbriiglobus ruber]
MAETSQKWNRWQQTRQMGRQRFVWLYGVCGWGLSVGVLWSIGFWYISDPHPPFWLVIGLGLLGFPPGGYLWGRLMWWWFERSRLTAEQSKV